MPNIHKDFHGAMSYGVQFLVERYGEEGLREYLRRLARTVYAPLSERLAEDGLSAMAGHLARVFILEDGDVELSYDGDALTLKVNRCPAIHHMREHGYAIAPHFCETTRVVNEEICRAAGYECSVEYDQEAGRCVQNFRRATP